MTSEDSAATLQIPTQKNKSIEVLKAPASSILPSEERMETQESNISELNLTPRSKALKKLMKKIKHYFLKTGEAPESTSEFYTVGKMLGKGAFGKVNLALHKLSGGLVAVKSINK